MFHIDNEPFQKKQSTEERIRTLELAVEKLKKENIFCIYDKDLINFYNVQAKEILQWIIDNNKLYKTAAIPSQLKSSK